MLRKILAGLLALLVVLALYLALWPVPIDPVAWVPPPNPGFTGPHAPNERLKNPETFPLAGRHGPEDIALDGRGRIYAAVDEGAILRLDPDGSHPRVWAETGGRPLGIDFDAAGNLIVADAVRGLLSIAPDGAVTPLADAADGVPFGFTDDVDVAADGRIYFSDASSKFSVKEYGSGLVTSRLDLMEHGGHGRLLVYDPATGKAATLLDGLNFANGVAVSHDQQFVLVNETGTYRVIRYWIAGPRRGTSEPLIEALPGMPDNISTGAAGRFWIAFATPRLPDVEAMAGSPFLRKMVMRLPGFMLPKPIFYGHIIAIDAQGKVLADLQDPSGGYPITTSVTETRDTLYIGSLVAPVLARLPLARAGL